MPRAGDMLGLALGMWAAVTGCQSPTRERDHARSDAIADVPASARSHPRIPIRGDASIVARAATTRGPPSVREPAHADPDAVITSLDDIAPPIPDDVAVVFAGPSNVEACALTFDDGPSRENTPKILAVLRRLGVRATFFVEGRRVQRFPQLTRQIVEDGHEIASHGYSHRSFRSLWHNRIRDELVRTEAAIATSTGVRPRFVRPPFGRFPPSSMALFEQLGMEVVLWSVDSHDWELDDPVEIARVVRHESTNGSVILLHDRTPEAVRALPDIIRDLQTRNLMLVTISQLTWLAPYREPPE